MGEGSPKIELTPEKRLKLANDAQIAICVLLLDGGHINDIRDFTVRYAPLIRMIINGEMSITERSWEEINGEVRALVRSCKNVD